MTKTAGDAPWKLATPNETTGSRPKEDNIAPTTGGLYVHVPFCRHKCPYCHFMVLPYREDLVERYLKALLQEWEMRKAVLKEISTLYFGGGTPSLLGGDLIAQLIQRFQPLQPDAEITIEANPEDVTLELMQSFHKAGINRVSIGVQSLDNSSLTLIERRHSAEKAIEAVLLTHQAGIENISIDLMYDLPYQTLTSFERTLAQVEKLPITHLSLYNLTFEPGSSYYRQQKKIARTQPEEECSLAMLQLAIAKLEAMGLKRYEISAFAKAGYEARHNSSYWTYKPFLGIGPSAFSYLKGSRLQNEILFPRYLAALNAGRLPTHFTETLPPEEALREELAVRLRLLAGVDLTALSPLPTELIKSLHTLCDQGYLSANADFSHIALTSQGTLFYDSVASDII